jgi:hypothetical protein
MTAIEISDDVLRELAYGVARGVRPLALAGSCAAEHDAMLVVQTRLESQGEPGAIAFVCPRGDDGLADYGYAAAAWVIDLYRWVVGATEDEVPSKHRHRVVGLLLGYSVPAVANYEEQAAGRACHLPLNGTEQP